MLNLKSVNKVLDVLQNGHWNTIYAAGGLGTHTISIAYDEYPAGLKSGVIVYQGMKTVSHPAKPIKVKYLYLSQVVTDDHVYTLASFTNMRGVSWYRAWVKYLDYYNVGIYDNGHLVN